MDDKKLFSKILKLKAPWFIIKVNTDEELQQIDVWVDHEKHIQVMCPKCEQFYSVYDHAPERVYRHLNVCQMKMFIHIRMPRVNCPEHGVLQIYSEFGENGSDMTYEFEKLVIDFAKECSIQAIGRLYDINWDRCWNTVERAVDRGKKRKPHALPKRIGVDEKSFTKGHKYETIVTDIDNGTVEFVCDNRQQESLESYYKQFKQEELANIQAVAMDMWDPFIAATKAHVPGAEKKIVFDKFHVMGYATKAVDKTRIAEHKTLKESGDETLKGVESHDIFTNHSHAKLVLLEGCYIKKAPLLEELFYKWNF